MHVQLPLSNTFHVFCPTLPMFSVQCLPPFLSNTSHVFCPTPPRFSVRDLPRFLSNTSQIFCMRPPMFSVQHLPCFLSNTSHVFSPTPTPFSVQYLPLPTFCPHHPHFLSNTTIVFNNNATLSKATNSWEHQTQLPVLYHPWPLACRIEHVTGWPANGAAGPSSLSCPRAVYSMRRMGQRYPEEKDMRLIMQMWLHSNKW